MSQKQTATTTKTHCWRVVGWLVGCIQSVPAIRFRKFCNCNSVRPIKIVESDINVENSKVVRNEKRYRFRVRFSVKNILTRSKVNTMKSCRFCVATKLWWMQKFCMIGEKNWMIHVLTLAYTIAHGLGQCVCCVGTWKIRICICIEAVLYKKKAYVWHQWVRYNITLGLAYIVV